MANSAHRSTIPSTIPENATHQQYIPTSRRRGIMWLYLARQGSIDGHAAVMPSHMHLRKLLVSGVHPIPSCLQYQREHLLISIQIVLVSLEILLQLLWNWYTPLPCGIEY